MTWMLWAALAALLLWVGAWAFALGWSLGEAHERRRILRALEQLQLLARQAPGEEHRAVGPEEWRRIKRKWREQ